MSFVQHLAVLNTLENRSEMSDMGRSRAGLQADAREEVICPKPRRLPLISCCAPELMKPKCQWQSPPSRIPELEAGYEILEIFLNKNASGESPKFGFSPPDFLDSPPSRAGNPIVNDVQFCYRRSPPPMVLADPKALSRLSFTPSPPVRIEGFDCSHRDSRRGVPAIA